MSQTRTKYAVLYSGLSDYRHLNELEYMYRTLTTHCNFLPEHVFALHFNGTYDYFGLPKPVTGYPDPAGGQQTSNYSLPIYGRGTGDDLEKAFEMLTERLSPEDLLFIHTSGHGGGAATPFENKMSTLCDFQTYPSVTSGDLNRLLSTLPDFDSLVVMLSQCHSGGFVMPILTSASANRCHVVASAPYYQESVAEMTISPFARSWIDMWASGEVDDLQQAFYRAMTQCDSGDKPICVNRFGSSISPIDFTR